MVAKPKGLVRGKIVHSREATKFDKVVKNIVLCKI